MPTRTCAGNEEFVTGVAEREEARFRATLRAGLAMLESELAEGEPTVSGEVAFRLHDTHGFPIELTREIAAERGATVDEDGFDRAMARQREQSKQPGRMSAVTGPGDLSTPTGRSSKSTGPRGSWATPMRPPPPPCSRCSPAPAPMEVRDQAIRRPVEIFLDVTPFYAEGGGQVGDTGMIETDTGRARVLDTTYALPGLTRHVAVVEEGEIRPGQTATAAIDAERRAAIRRNHTGTHLLHWALRAVLGDHVKQQGSLVAPDRLRFDFTHYGPVTAEEIGPGRGSGQRQDPRRRGRGGRR